MLPKSITASFIDNTSMPNNPEFASSGILGRKISRETSAQVMSV
jgi:hypothetical protein